MGNIEEATPTAENNESDGKTNTAWFLYMIRCNGGFLYTGITTDVSRRFAQHQAGKGAKYLRGKAPLELVFQKLIGSRSDALKLEAKVKKWAKTDKEHIIRFGWVEKT